MEYILKCIILISMGTMNSWHKNWGGCHIERQDESYACVAAALAD